MRINSNIFLAEWRKDSSECKQRLHTYHTCIGELLYAIKCLASFVIEKLPKKIDTAEDIRAWEDSSCRDNCIRQLPINYILKQKKGP